MAIQFGEVMALITSAMVIIIGAVTGNFIRKLGGAFILLKA